MSRLKRFLSVVPSLFRDWRACARVSADPRSALRLGFDFALSRLVGLLPENQVGAVRKVRFKGGINLCYRLNKGDLHGIREVWFDEAYRLPFEDPSGTLLDLGANIGLTSVWLAKRYPFSRVIAVEPDPSNAALVRRNLELNGIHGEVLQTAIGDHEGTAMFALNRNSNLGRLSDHGVAVPMTTVAAILENAACSRLGLVKIDIEGGEQQLFDGPIDWLASTDAIIAELHPALADCSRIVETISKRGFEYIRSNSVFPDNMDCFKSTDSS